MMEMSGRNEKEWDEWRRKMGRWSEWERQEEKVEMMEMSGRRVEEGVG
jgi:hypothetical protein